MDSSDLPELQPIREPKIPQFDQPTLPKPMDRKKRRRGGCGSCLGKLVILALFVGAGLASLLHILNDMGRLPSWAKIPDMPWEKGGGSSESGKDVEYDPNQTWIGHQAASRSFKSPNFRAKKNRAITSIVLHSTESSSATSAINHFQNRSSQVSAHYIVGRDGKVYQMVDERHVAWHCRGANWETIGIELVSMQQQQIAPAQKNALIALLVDLMDRHSIPRWRITGHNFTEGYTGQTSCPNNLFGGNRPHHLNQWLGINLDPVIGEVPTASEP